MMNACPRWSLLTLPLLASLACSDPVPLPAKGGLTLQVGQPIPPVTQKSCPVTHTYQIGAYQAKTMTTLPPVSASDHGQSVVDGDGGAKVKCSVKASTSGGFDFSGSLNANTLQGDSVSITFDNGHIAADSTGTANVQVFTQLLGAPFSSGTTPCTLQGIDVNLGHLFASMYCAQMTSPPSGLCAIGSTSAMASTSFVVFENCDGSP